MPAKLCSHSAHSTEDVLYFFGLTRWQQQQKLIATRADGYIRTANCPADSSGKIFDHLITRGVTELVINVFQLDQGRAKHCQPARPAINDSGPSRGYGEEGVTTAIRLFNTTQDCLMCCLAQSPLAKQPETTVMNRITFEPKQYPLLSVQRAQKSPVPPPRIVRPSARGADVSLNGLLVRAARTFVVGSPVSVRLPVPVFRHATDHREWNSRSLDWSAYGDSS